MFRQGYEFCFLSMIAGTVWCLSSGQLVAEERYTPGQPLKRSFDEFAKGFLQQHCFDCHGQNEPSGGLSLIDLGPINETNAATWKSIWAQVTLKQMPPKDVDSPEIVSRLQFSDWIVDRLKHVMRDKGGFADHLDPGKGNFVDHDLLFGTLPESIRLVPTSSPARLWRVTREEHLTRLNELINQEPAYNAKKPGLRTRGDVVPTNHGGELKMYFGTDRIIAWHGGTVAYATSVKSTPAILSSARQHGLENYPNLYSVNSAEATQILDLADDIIRYMAYGPLSIAEDWQISDDKSTIRKIVEKYNGSDIRGLPIALVYSTKIARPLTPVYELMKTEGVEESQLKAAVDFVFEATTFRSPTDAESNQYVSMIQDAIKKLGKEDGVPLGLSSIFLDRDALFRPELVADGTPDQHGRIMLQDCELGLAVNHALRYIQPDAALKTAIVEGRMRTREDVRREVQRMLADPSIRKPRVLQFFRDFFDYDLGGYICKDNRALAETGIKNRGTSHYRAMFDATASTDRLIELILSEDRDVLRQLLTTDRAVVTRSDINYFGRMRSAEEKKEFAAIQRKKATAEIADQKQKIQLAKQELAEFQAWLEAHPDQATSKKSKRELTSKKQAVSSAEKRLSNLKKNQRRDKNHAIQNARLPGERIYARVSRRSFGAGSMKPERTLTTVPAGQRLGILTHPSWLVSHSDAMDNHAIRRGRWIRERLLGGGIPDVPITVDAMLPDEPKNTLRKRMRVTRQEYCWSCHQKMDPLGLPFEMYNHAGVYREIEKNGPVDTSGEIIDSGDPELDGSVTDALDMIQKIANSQRAEQVFVRHAFRFWMGRNETLHDGPVLQDAWKAYKKNGGSMNAMLVSLLTSDAFLYRSKTNPTE